MAREIPIQYNRRALDPRLNKVVGDVETLQGQHAVLLKEVRENTAVTLQIKDILEGFRLAGRCAKFVAKWATVVTAILLAAKHGWEVIAAILHLARDEK